MRSSDVSTDGVLSEGTRTLQNLQLKGPTNEESFFFCLHALETFVGETFFAFEQQKMFLNFFRNIFCRSNANKCCLGAQAGQNCYRNILRSVFATILPHLPEP